MALAQQLFQVSRQVPAELEVFDTEVLPDGQLRLEFRDGSPVEHVGFRNARIQPPLRDAFEPRRNIFVTNETDPPVRLLLTDPWHPAIDTNTGQEIGFFFADLSSGWRWNVVAGEWRVPEYQDEEYAGHSCDNQKPAEWRLLPGQTYRMTIGLKLHSEFEGGPGDYNLAPVVIGGVGGELPAPEPVPPPGGMVGWWPADGNVEDIIGGNHGAPPFADFVDGMVQQGLGLDGIDDHVLVPDNTGDLNITGDVTVDLWAKRTVFDESFHEMISKSGVGEQGNSGDVFDMWFRPGNVVAAGALNTNGEYDIIVGPVVEDSDFHHYAYVRSGNRHMLFMDGQEVASGELTAQVADTSGVPMTIGAFRWFDDSGFCCRFGGVIDEVEVFNRALSAGKIKPMARIAFASTGDGDWEIYVMNADGTGQTRLTVNTADDFSPAWSPDGGKIAFVYGRDGNFDIYVMNADGSGQTPLTNNPADEFDPDWSPDGIKIAFFSLRDDGDEEVYVMTADGTGQTRLTNLAGGDRGPTWSPDGSKIGFHSFRVSDWEIYVMNADGTGQTNLTNNSVHDEHPAWSPDGGKIAFVSLRDSNWDVYVMNADGTGQTRLTTSIADENAPRWSPDSNKIAFQTLRDGNYEIYVMNVDGTGQTNLTNNPSHDITPDWSPGVVP